MSSIPEGFLYTTDHEWLRMTDEFTAICGITDHAQEMLTDIVFVELPEVNLVVKKGERVAVVESVKAVSDVFAPVSGLITAVNRGLEDTPELLNSEPYGEGWVFRIEVKHPRELEDLLGPDAYASHVQSGT